MLAFVVALCFLLLPAVAFPHWGFDAPVHGFLCFTYHCYVFSFDLSLTFAGFPFPFASRGAFSWEEGGEA